MYYPYLRGRQSELFALRDTALKLSNKKKVCPVIEPVMSKTGGLKAFLEAAKAKHPHVVIVNPGVGELVGQSNTIQGLIAPYLLFPGNGLYPGYLVGPTTTQSEVNSFLRFYAKHQTALVFSRPNAALHAIATKLTATTPPICIFIDGKVSPTFMSTFTGNHKVLIRDGFIAQVKNALYPPTDFFTNLNLTYAASGFQGFGDFTIIEDQYAPGGGPAHAVAIHLTEQNAAREIDTKHFVSTRTTGAVDTPGKFMEALDKAVAHIRGRRTSFAFSQACREYEDLHTRRHFPGLPKVKRLSIRHHIELMDSIV